MDPRTFDHWTIAIARPPTRRAALRLLAGGLLGGILTGRLTPAGAQGDLPAGSCAVGLVDCDGLCVNLVSDPLNCGACGIACEEGAGCQDGFCTVLGGGGCKAGSGLTYCNGTCVDLLSDGDNCGACGVVCPDYPEIYSCEGGACVPPSCGAGLVNCGGLCADLLSDPLHCGACGVACAAGQACQFGVCTATTTAPPSSLTCAPGLTDCGGFCVDLSVDPFNCGACGIACGSGGTCTFGVCPVGAGEQGEAVACAPGLTDCGGSCVDLLTHPSHCGGCARVCADGFCQGGSCAAPADDFNSDAMAGNGGVAQCRGLGVVCDFDGQCCNTPNVLCCWDGISLQVECTDVSLFGGRCPQ
jgi:hypothetical protein